METKLFKEAIHQAIHSHPLISDEIPMEIQYNPKELAHPLAVKISLVNEGIERRRITIPARLLKAFSSIFNVYTEGGGAPLLVRKNEKGKDFLYAPIPIQQP